jgi:hypothetical protein
MGRAIAFLPAMILSVVLGVSAAGAQGMKPTAPEKMMSPQEEKIMRACQREAARQNIKMDARAKYVMDCMTAKAK